MNDSTWASGRGELMGMPRRTHPGWRYLGWLMLFCLGLSTGFHIQFYNSDRAEMLRALVGSYVSDTEFVYQIGPDRVSAMGHVASPSRDDGAKRAYRLDYQIAKYESAEALAAAFEADKRKLRAGETQSVAGNLTEGVTNRELKGIESVAFYGFMPGMFYSTVPFMMIAIGAVCSAVMLRVDSSSAKVVCLGSVLMMGLSLPSFFPEVMVGVTEPYVMVEQTRGLSEGLEFTSVFPSDGA